MPWRQHVRHVPIAGTMDSDLLLLFRRLDGPSFQLQLAERRQEHATGSSWML